MQAEKNKKKIPPAALYALAVLLLGFYAYILVSGLKYDRVSEGYRAYYIDRTLDRYVSDKVWEESFSVGKEISFKRKSNVEAIGYGLSEPEEEGSWFTRPQAGFYIYAPEKPEGAYELRISKSLDEGCRKRLSVNGKDLGEIDFGEEEIRIAIPGEQLAKGLNRFEFAGSEEDDEDYPPTIRSVGLFKEGE